jgi:hypothetical protein
VTLATSRNDKARLVDQPFQETEGVRQRALTELEEALELIPDES